MLRNRRAWCSLGWLLALLGCASSALAQDDGHPRPFSGGPPLETDLQYFRPVDDSGYGDEPSDREGFWGTWELMILRVPAPERALIGNDETRVVFNVVVPQDPTQPPGGGATRFARNSLDTSAYESLFHRGQRVEFGYSEAGQGWQAGMFTLAGHSQEITQGDVEIIFRDPDGLMSGFVDITGAEDGGPDGIPDDLDFDFCFGNAGCDIGTENDTPPPAFIPPPDGEIDIPFFDAGDLVTLPSLFEEFQAVLDVEEFWGVDFLRTWRTRGGLVGGWVEVGAGLRFMKFDDDFNVRGYGGVLDESFWNTEADNNLFGPQVSLRWFNRVWIMQNSFEVRFMPALNQQSIRQRGTIGEFATGTPNTPLALGPRGFNHAVHEAEFSPVVDLRVETAMQITDYISLTAGFNALYLDGLARSSSMVDYDLVGMGILESENTQDMFIFGGTLGVELNR
jgi:hypothetical protein